MMTWAEEIGIGAGRTLAETGGENETLEVAMIEGRSDIETVETVFVMIGTGTAVKTETVARIAAMTAIVGTIEIGGMNVIDTMAGIGATTAISIVIGTEKVVMEGWSTMTPIAAARMAEMLPGASGRRLFQRRTVGIGESETRIWSSTPSQN